MMTDAGTISTLYGAEFAALLIEARIPFEVNYEMEVVTLFHVGSDDIDRALKLMMKLRGSKL